MNGLPYYKAYPRDFIEGTIGMPFEVKCAYRVVLDLIYMQGGNLPDDARYISGLLGCSVRKWNSIREALVSSGKLEVSGEFLTNYRAVSELETLAKVQDKQAENARGPRKIKDLEKPPQNHTEPEPEPIAATQHRAAGAIDYRKLTDQLLEAAGISDFREERNPKLLHVGPIVGLIQAGYSLRDDILPYIRAKAAAGFRPRSWGYYVEGIKDDAKHRLGIASEAKPDPKAALASWPDSKWQTVLEFARERREWSSQTYGPPPFADGCLVPKHLLSDADRQFGARRAA
ncbi:hypothetical protein GCM10007989_07540 [Devosia pacifica]|uniref:DUF1376 domain-containing protein n=1 Tax=Devosia pacifica TaxID=1335967 RepID=A0A918VQM9_9HYPH|nr:DUF1376 domain-containing protein [Devosia pacifica]GHA15268.1 hypothetical protein GCM10007989_07540 [Devosia pacifica]